MAETAVMLAEAGLPVEEVSIGSTPTMSVWRGWPGITEIRPGTYVFNDANLARSGAAGLQDCALSILATVTSRPAPGRLILDAGSKSLAGDQAHQAGGGYGIVKGRPDLILERIYEEHGVAARLRRRVGDRTTGDRRPGGDHPQSRLHGGEPRRRTGGGPGRRGHRGLGRVGAGEDALIGADGGRRSRPGARPWRRVVDSLQHQCAKYEDQADHQRDFLHQVKGRRKQDKCPYDRQTDLPYVQGKSVPWHSDFRWRTGRLALEGERSADGEDGRFRPVDEIVDAAVDGEPLQVKVCRGGGEGRFTIQVVSIIPPPTPIFKTSRSKTKYPARR